MNARELLDLEGIPAEESALVGVSGGRDSVALLHLLLVAGQQRLIVCHLDHGLRRESGEDAAFVQSLAESRGCEVVIAREDVRALAATQKLSIEAAARRARLRFFAECAGQYGTSRVFLGHHARDQAETVLINLVRGSGASGLSGMSRISELKVGDRKLQFVRPLLHRQMEEIFALPGIAELPFREDASNTSPDFLRNRIRHEVLPLLADVAQRDVVTSLARAADLLREEDALLREMAAEVLEEVRTESGMLQVRPLRSMPVALQRRVLHEWLRSQDVSGLSFDLVKSVRALLEPGSQTVARVNLRGGRHVRRREGVLFVE